MPMVDGKKYPYTKKGKQAAEAARQAIRDKYAAIQADIDAATTPEEIKAALGGA